MKNLVINLLDLFFYYIQTSYYFELSFEIVRDAKVPFFIKTITKILIYQVTLIVAHR